MTMSLPFKVEARSGAARAGVLTTAANLPLDVPVPQTLCATSLGLWGGYVGWQTGDLLGVDPLAVALPASDVGLRAGGVLVSPLVGVPPLVLGVADAGGVFGGATGALVAGLATADPDVVTAASLAGAGVGGAVGLAVGAGWHRSQGRRDVVANARIVLDEKNGFRSLAQAALRCGGIRSSSYSRRPC